MITIIATLVIWMMLKTQQDKNQEYFWWKPAHTVSWVFYV